MKRALLIAGGTLNIEFAREYIQKNQFDCVVAIDNGLWYADNLFIVPNVIVGDFDTASEQLVDKYKHNDAITVIQLIPEKDATDTETAVDYVIKMGYDEVVFLGAMGGRFDHTLANVQMLYRLLQHKIRGYLMDEKNRIRLIECSTTVNQHQLYGTYISLLPFSEMVEKITLNGFKYPLKDFTMEQGTSIGISNEINSEIGEISFEKGILILIEAHD